MNNAFPRVLTTLACLCLLTASTTGYAAASERPAYQTLRFNEDWSSFADAASDSADPLDRIKHIGLSDDGTVYLSLGGQLRARGESWNGTLFRETGDDDTFVLGRLLLHADLHLNKHLRVFVQGKSALATDRDLPGGRRTLELDEAALQNGFIQGTAPLGDTGHLVVRAGRQELLLGKQRLVSPLDWANSRRTFDGVTAAVHSGNWTATAIAAHIVTIRKYESNSADESVDLHGIYATRRSDGPEPNLDVYWLRLDDKEASFQEAAAEEERDTFGARAWNAYADLGVDWELEATYQTGEIGSGDIDAYAAMAQVGWRPADLATRPRFEIGFDYASGDSDPDDDDAETFNQLFPLGHAFLGFIDIVGRQNIMDARANVALTPCEATKLRLDIHQFWRADRDDALYNAGGGVVRAGDKGDSKDVGTEIDLTLSRRFDVHAVATVGYSHFFAGDFIDESGPSEDTDFAYISLQYTL